MKRPSKGTILRNISKSVLAGENGIAVRIPLLCSLASFCGGNALSDSGVGKHSLDGINAQVRRLAEVVS